jgi:heptosyltransferase-2
MHCVARRGRAPQRPNNILVVKLDGIGDVVLATPFLRELKRSFPAASITLLVKPVAAPLVELCPHVARVRAFDPVASSELRAWLYALQLWRDRFDLAILPRWDADFYYGYCLLCGSGARHIVAYARTMSAVPHDWLARAEQRHATILASEAPEHEVRRNLRLIEALGGSVSSDELEISLSPKDHERAAQWWHGQSHNASQRLIAFGIGAGHAARRWPEERFAELAEALAHRYKAHVVLIGDGDADRARAARIVGLARRPVSSAVGIFTLRETAALLSRCALFVGNDSGPMHLAAAVRLAVVEISGLPGDGASSSHFSPARFGPWRVRARVVRPPCQAQRRAYRDDDPAVLDIRGVGVESVLAAIEDLACL